MSDLDGATEPGAENVYPADAGEFAARWNAMTPDARDHWVRGYNQGHQERMTCLLQDHEGAIGRLTAERDTLRSFADLTWRPQRAEWARDEAARVARDAFEREQSVRARADRATDEEARREGPSLAADQAAVRVALDDALQDAQALVAAVEAAQLDASRKAKNGWMAVWDALNPRGRR